MKHKDLIIKWANGAKVEAFIAGKWKLIPEPFWTDEIEFREHNPARTAFEAGKKVLARDENEWTRLRKLEDFDFNWDEYAVVEPDTYWYDKFVRGAKLQFQFFNKNEWINVTDAFCWKYNSAYKFREILQPKVFTQGPIVMRTEGCLVRTDIPVSFYNLNTQKVQIEIDLANGEIKFVD